MAEDRIICADQNIPHVEDAFSRFGTVRTLPGREISPDAVQDVDVLLVRSVTRVDSALLKDSCVRFVGSATIGTDHVDRQALQDREIAFAHAPGSNADSVADYVIAALLHVAVRRGVSISDCTIGIVGCGNIGGRLARRLPNLGAAVLLNDPPRRMQGDAPSAIGSSFRPLSELLDAADVITLHTPLTTDGPHPTHHLFDADTIAAMNPGAWLINTSRGAVVDNRALVRALDDGPVQATILDVWEEEPSPHPQWIRRSDVATPHIAGYARDGKLRGTKMLYDAFCRFQGVSPVWTPDDALQPESPDALRCTPPDGSLPPTDYLDALAAQMVDIEGDDARFRRVLEVPAEDRGNYFSTLRKTYPERREMQQHRIPAAAVPHRFASAVEKGLAVSLTP